MARHENKGVCALNRAPLFCTSGAAEGVSVDVDVAAAAATTTDDSKIGSGSTVGVASGNATVSESISYIEVRFCFDFNEWQ